MIIEWLDHVLDMVNKNPVSAFVFVCTYVLYIFAATRLILWYLSKVPSNLPPGPSGFPVLGVLPLITSRPDKKVLEWARKYGGVMKLPFLNNNIIIISSKEHLNEGLVRNGVHYADRPTCFFHDTILNRNGIASTNYSEDWKEQRKFTLTSLRKFGFGKRQLVDKIVEETDFFIKEVFRNEGDFQKARELLTELNANVIVQLCFNRRFDHENDKEYLQFFHKVAEHFNNASFALQATVFVPWLESCFQNVLSPMKKFFNKFHNVLRTEVNNHVKHYRNDGDNDVTKDFCDDYLKRMTSLDSNNKGLFNDETLLWIIRDFLLAGTETMASTLTWAILILANRKDTVLKKIREEIDEIVGDELPSLDHKDNMHYTQAFLQELLRYRTILPFAVPRRTTCDTELAGYDIPKGTTVVQNIYGVHNDPEVWDNPEMFKVERHLDCEGKFKKSPFVIPFGVGIRYCIGRQLASIQMFIVLVRMLQKFDFVTSQHQCEEPAQGGFVTMVKFDTKIKIVERTE